MAEEAERKQGRLLVVAGSDSGGGAGLQADVKTATALGAWAATAVTALTVQNTVAVSGVVETAPQAVRAQMSAVLSDMGADAVKTGMLGGAALVEAVAEALASAGMSSRVSAGAPAVVVDPVMVATTGAILVPAKAVAAIAAVLVPLADLVTPNAPEAEVLTGKTVDTIDGQRRAAERLLEMGAKAALVKGGHIPGDAIVDVLATHDGEHFFETARIGEADVHGTGCTLASGIAAGLARGLSLIYAVELSRAYLIEAIRGARKLGAGALVLDHAWPSRNPEAYAAMLQKWRPS